MLRSAPTTDISSNAIVIWVSIAVVVFLAVGTITDKGLGPISRAWYEFAKRRRTAAAGREAADLTELRRTVTNLVGMRESDEERATAQDKRISDLEAVIVAYSRWSYRVQLIASQAGIDLPEPPNLDT